MSASLGIAQYVEGLVIDVLEAKGLGTSTGANAGAHSPLPPPVVDAQALIADFAARNDNDMNNEVAAVNLDKGIKPSGSGCEAAIGGGVVAVTHPITRMGFRFGNSPE